MMMMSQLSQSMSRYGWLAGWLLTWQQPDAWEYDYKSVTHPRALRWFSCGSNEWLACRRCSCCSQLERRRVTKFVDYDIGTSRHEMKVKKRKISHMWTEAFVEDIVIKLDIWVDVHAVSMHAKFNLGNLIQNYTVRIFGLLH